MRRLNKKKLFSIYLVITILIIVFTFTYTAMASALLKAGAKPPEFSIKDIEGKNISLSDYSEKKAVIILFWSTWSRKSKDALERFEGYYKKYRERGIQVISINADNEEISDKDLEKIKGLITDLDITFPVLLDRGLNTFHSYDVIALPSTIVISDNKIEYEMPGFPLIGAEDMFDYLLVLAGEPPRKVPEPKYEPKHAAIASANLASKFAQRKKYKMAYSLFKKAIKQDPKYMIPYIQLSKLYEKENKTEEASETLKQALAVEPENPVMISELGYILAKTGKLNESIEMLEKATEKDSYTPAHYYYGYALGMAGKIDEALKAFENALALNPFESMTYTLRAEVYENKNMLKEASSDYKKALELKLNQKD